MADPPTRDKTPPKKVITDGDRLVNMVEGLSDLALATSQLKSTIAHLKEFVSDELDSGGVKNVIMKQIRLLERASDYVGGKVSFVTSQTSLSTVTGRKESRKRADFNYDIKLESK